MSKIALVSNASGTGTLSLVAPNTNSDRAIALPDAAGTIALQGGAISGTTGTFTGLLDISAAGAGQIQFPATQNASANANTLDDYEEGTWTPTIAGFTTAGTGTYSAQDGTYTKIGRLVSITGFVAWSAHTGTGIMCLQGFPFGAGSGSSFRTPFSLSEIGNIALSANNTLQMQMQNTSQAFFMQSPVGGGLDATVPMDSAGYVRFSCTYFTT